MSDAVDVRDASVTLGGRQILREVDLHVRVGEVVTLLGANGSGKSTLVRAVVGLNPLSGGTVQLFDTPLGRFRDWGRVGFVPQRTTAQSGVPATVREVVAAGRLSHAGPFRRLGRADHDAIDRAIELVGLSHRARESVALLSGGQQQRVLVARAAAAEPDLLILDEPNAGVDKDSQEAFAVALSTFVATGRTVLLVLHELGPLAGLIDRSVVLRDGVVVHDGPLPPALQEHAGHDHDHVHPHAPTVEGGLFS